MRTHTVIAEVRKIGGPDTGHVGAVCEGCRDAKGRPWQVWHSRRTIEGYRLAERDAEDHNRARHRTGSGGSVS